jgi:hypothetical protein
MEDIYYMFNPWWEKKKFNTGIKRKDYLKQINNSFKRKQINVILGGRRVGKTTFIKQLIEKCINNSINPKSILYLSLDHPRLYKIPLSEHLKYFRKLFMHSRKKKLYLFLDEIHENINWESELKGIYDLENVKIVISGSTSELLNSQGGKLTGRQIVMKIYPLDFKEYIEFIGQKPDKTENYKYEKLLENYFKCGGYPENVLNHSDEYLNNLLEDIIARDIVKLYNIRNPNILKDLFVLISSSIGTKVSYNRLSNVLGLSVDAVKEYINYFESAFLLTRIEKWTTSNKEKIYSNKKIYLNDIAFKTLITGPGDLGFKLENVFFNYLFRNGLKPGYFNQENKEIDFVFKHKNKVNVYETKYITDFNFDDKKFASIKFFIKKNTKIKEINIITKNVEQTYKTDTVTLNIIPAWKALIN